MRKCSSSWRRSGFFALVVVVLTVAATPSAEAQFSGLKEAFDLDNNSITSVETGQL